MKGRHRIVSGADLRSQWLRAALAHAQGAGISPFIDRPANNNC
jgi:hypothetical protein